MKTNSKRLLSALLALMMLISLLPATALTAGAADGDVYKVTAPHVVKVDKTKAAAGETVTVTADETIANVKAFDADGNPMPDENGRNQVETRKVAPQAIKEALVESRRRWAEAHSAPRPLAEHAMDARACSEAMRADGAPEQPQAVRGE